MVKVALFPFGVLHGLRVGFLNHVGVLEEVPLFGGVARGFGIRIPSLLHNFFHVWPSLNILVVVVLHHL